MDDGATKGSQNKNPTYTAAVMRKPKANGKKRGGIPRPSDGEEGKEKREEEAGKVMTKMLHTRGRGVGCQASHLPLYLPLYSPVSFFAGLVRSTGGVGLTAT